MKMRPWPWGRQENVRIVEILAAGQQMVRVPARPAEAQEKPPKRKWAGSIPATSADAWDKHLQEIRNEWERDI